MKNRKVKERRVCDDKSERNEKKDLASTPATTSCIHKFQSVLPVVFFSSVVVVVPIRIVAVISVVPFRLYVYVTFVSFQLFSSSFH